MGKVERAGLAEMRRRLLAQAAGDVLEIGGGTGANLACYPAVVTSLTVTEPERVNAQAPQAPRHGSAPRRRW